MPHRYRYVVLDVETFLGLGQRDRLAQVPQGGGLRLWVADTGVGMADSAVPGTGLNNLRERLAVFYGPGAALRLDAVMPQGLHAELRIPAAALSP